MTDVDTLAALLERLNEEEDPTDAKREARELLATIDPVDLSAAEQKLLEAGLSLDDLKSFCQVHMDLVREQCEDLRQSLPPRHVLGTFLGEHDAILGFVDMLEGVNLAIQRLGSCEAASDELDKLNEIAEHLLAAELHHRREEEVLFPELIRRGLTGPPEMMRAEHGDLRDCKNELAQLAAEARTKDWQAFKRQLDETAGYLIERLRDHIFKEDYILYPTAMRLIPEAETWDRIRTDCDEIGYCCFTPEA